MEGEADIPDVRGQSLRDRYSAFISRHEIAWELGMGFLAVVFVAVGFAIDQTPTGPSATLEDLELFLTGVFVGCRLWTLLTIFQPSSNLTRFRKSVHRWPFQSSISRRTFADVPTMSTDVNRFPAGRGSGRRGQDGPPQGVIEVARRGVAVANGSVGPAGQTGVVRIGVVSSADSSGTRIEKRAKTASRTE